MEEIHLEGSLDLLSHVGLLEGALPFWEMRREAFGIRINYESPVKSSIRVQFIGHGIQKRYVSNLGCPDPLMELAKNGESQFGGLFSVRSLNI